MTHFLYFKDRFIRYLNEYIDFGQSYSVTEIVAFLNNRQDEFVFSDSFVRNYLEYHSDTNNDNLFSKEKRCGKVYYKLNLRRV